MSRAWRYGDVVEWDTPAEWPHTAIRWFIIGLDHDFNADGYKAIWMGGGAPQHWVNMAERTIQFIGAKPDDPTNRLLTEDGNDD